MPFVCPPERAPGQKSTQDFVLLNGVIMTIPEASIYAELLEHGLDAAFLTRPDGTILYANPAACALFGYTLAEFQALGRSAVVDPSDPRLLAALAQRRETGRFQGVLTMRRKDGSRFSAALSSAVYTNSSGELRTSMFVRDLTAQEQREEALRVAHAALNRALAEVRQLQGILPMCSYCKRIRNDEHYWQQVEAYISAHAPVQFSHSICPTCYEHHVLPQLEQLRGKTT
jgi:PAS domain S-box-containing protein